MEVRHPSHHTLGWRNKEIFYSFTLPSRTVAMCGIIASPFNTFSSRACGFCIRITFLLFKIHFKQNELKIDNNNSNKSNSSLVSYFIVYRLSLVGGRINEYEWLNESIFLFAWHTTNNEEEEVGVVIQYWSEKEGREWVLKRNLI